MTMLPLCWGMSILVSSQPHSAIVNPRHGKAKRRRWTLGSQWITNPTADMAEQGMRGEVDDRRLTQGSGLSFHNRKVFTTIAVVGVSNFTPGADIITHTPRAVVLIEQIPQPMSSATHPSPPSPRLPPTPISPLSSPPTATQR